MPLTPDEARVADAVDRDRLVTSVQRLVRIPSFGGDETPAQELMAELMDGAGLEVDRWSLDLPALQRHPACSCEIERDEALGLIGSLPGRGDGRTLVLNGHVDVVPPGDAGLWTHPPFSGDIVDGRIHGRGALDMKGPLLAGLFALEAVGSTVGALEGTIQLQSVIGEEDGGIGTLAAVLRSGPADGAVVMEPTELAVVPLQAGCLNFRVRVPGLAAHGAVREEGVSAFEKLFGVYGAIAELERRRNGAPPPDPLFARYRTPFPISIGTLKGGDWASSVPDHVAMEGRLGVRPDEGLAAARTELEAAVDAFADTDPWLREHRPVVEWWGGRFLPSRTATDHPLVTALAGAASDVRTEPARMEGVTFGADAGLLSNVGETPTVLFGAGDIRHAHRPDESVKIEELVAMARTLAVLALRFCG